MVRWPSRRFGLSYTDTRELRVAEVNLVNHETLTLNSFNIESRFLHFFILVSLLHCLIQIRTYLERLLGEFCEWIKSQISSAFSCLHVAQTFLASGSFGAINSKCKEFAVEDVCNAILIIILGVN